MCILGFARINETRQIKRAVLCDLYLEAGEDQMNNILATITVVNSRAAVLAWHDFQMRGMDNTVAAYH